ncbi:MAG: rod shape-determining protein MreD [Lachnospiraceae bacterium]|nr:rod shape-determining protein MreD [Lachnospiraceae bacterium]MDD3615862.1 rod shape-determining protein MreD [Lachnospiraceae bacterium]
MRRNLILALLIWIAFLLQTTVFQLLPFTTVAPNLLLILTVAFGFMNGKKMGLVIGFFCGLLIDLFYGDLIGFYALIYMLIGYVNGFSCSVFYDDEIKVPMVFIGISDLVYSVLIYILQFLLRGRLDFFYYFYHIMLPEVVYTVFITLLVYRLLYRLNYRFIATDTRGSSANWLRR